MAKGTGSVYKRGDTWYYTYSRDGVEYRKSAKTTDKTVALHKLKMKLREIDMGVLENECTIAQLIAAVLLDYQNEGKRSLDDARERWEKHLKPVFEHIRAKALTTAMLENYKAQRDAAGAAIATINRELALLRRAYNLGKRSTPPMVSVVPYFPLRREKNTRTGFLEDAQFDKLAAACAKRGLWLRAMLEVGYQFGWRAGEVRSLRVRHVDLAARTLRLDPHTTKNDDARVAVMPSVLFALIQQCATGKRLDDALFARDGQPVSDFRGSWEAATAEAGVPNLLFHDLRRTAARNMDRRGIPQTVIMRIMGLKTDAIFRRYRISGHADLLEAARKMDEKFSTVGRFSNCDACSTLIPLRAGMADWQTQRTQKRMLRAS